MIISKETVSNIVAYMLRNANTVELSGLYNGRAGLSLSLFIASKYLQDESIEDEAYKLMQEALLTKNSDMGFANGLSGIGYVLLYLVENKYLEADFNDIFGAQYKEIISHYENIHDNPSSIVNVQQIIHFLYKVGRLKQDNRLQMIIRHIFEGLDVFLALQFHDFDDIRYFGKKTEVLNIFKTYLKAIDYTGYTNFSRIVLDEYATLYRKGKITSSLETGYYLDRVVRTNNINGFDDIIRKNINNGAINIYPCTLSLKERVDMVKALSEIPNNEDVVKYLLSEIVSDQKEATIRKLLKTVDATYYPLGYGAGLARLLIFIVNKDIELL